MNYISRLAARIVAGSIFLCLAASLFAQNDNPTGKSGIFNGNSDTGASYDPYTANATRTVVDLTVPGTVGSYPLQWTRTMNSRRTEGPSYGFGSGGSWQHSYGWNIDWETESKRVFSANPLPRSYIVYYPDGRRVDFHRRASSPVDSAWRGPAGVTDRFQPVAGTGYCYLLLSDGGKVEFLQVGIFDPDLGWEFELHGPLRIIDPHGQPTSLHYTNGLLSQITEPAGRWLKINYTTAFGSQVIGSVQAGYSSNVTQSVTYSYQQFTVGAYNYTTLTGASYSDGTSAAYTYQPANTYPNTGPPLIQTCDDVRYSGPMKKIAYEFAAQPEEGFGGIYGQFAIARKWLWPAPSVVSYWLGGHAETRGDGPGRTFWYGPASNPDSSLKVPQPYLLSDFTDFNGKYTQLGYDANTYLNSVTDAHGNTTTFTNTPLTGKILTVTHPPDDTGVQSTRQFFYTNPNTAYYLDHVIDELAHRTGYQRDDKQRVKLINYPDGGTEEFTYDPTFGQVLTHKMTSGGTEAFEYDSRGRLLRYRDPYHDPVNKTGKPTAWYQYDALDRISAVTDWRGTGPGDLNYTTNYDYNQRGQLTRRTHPIDPVTGARYFVERTYNNDSTLATQTDERGNTTTYAHDDYKRVASVTAPLAFAGDTSPRITYLHYNRDGSATIDYRFTAAAVANVTLPSGRIEKTLYDNNFRKSSITVGSGAEAAITTYTYDAVGNLKTVVEPNYYSSPHMRTEYFYDKRDRLTGINNPHWMDRNSLGFTVSWTYDQIGNKKTQLRANNQLITYDRYDPMNRLQVQSVQHDAGVIDRTETTYDFAGNLRTFTDGRQKQYLYEHDLMNRRTKLTYPLDDSGAAREERYHYNLANSLDSYRNRAGAVQMFQYDSRNRRTHYSWSDGTSRSQWTVYDPVGNVTNVNNGVDTVESVYDGRNRKTSETQIAGIGVRWTVGYSYDADSNRLTVTHPAGHYFTNYYNTRNQLQFVDDNLGRVVTYAYDLSGNRTSRTLRNGTSTTYTPDALNRPISIDHRRGTTSFGRFDYHFDKVSRIDWVKRDLGHRGDVFGYYLDDQLKTAQFDAFQPDVSPGSPANMTSFIYDANGNRVSQDNATGFDYTYTANDLNQYNVVSKREAETEVTALSPLTPTYDTKGNLATYDQSAYSYDAHNRLTDATNNGVLNRFFYDALGRQILRGAEGQWIYSIWDGWDLIAEYNEQNVLLHSYVHGAGTDEMVVRFNGGPTIWYHQDAQGSTSHLTDDAGNLVERYKYDPALGGAPYIYNGSGYQIGSSAFNNRFLYTGRDWLKEVGLYDYRNRFYLPALGRFLQPDPIGFAGGDPNLYRYCGNNPVNRADASGLGGPVDVEGDRVKIDLPFVFLDPRGNVSPLGPQIAAGISQYLSGSFGSGQYTLETNAYVTGPSFGSNYITVDDRSGISRSVIGGSSGTWHIGQLFPGVSGAYIAAHEALHLLGLHDLYVPGAGGVGFKPGPDGKPMAPYGIDPNNFMVGRGGSGLYDWQIKIIINSNARGPLARLWQAVANAIQNDSGRLGAGNPGAYYHGTIYASASQAAGVMAWDKMYGTFGVATGGGTSPWGVYKKK